MEDKDFDLLGEILSSMGQTKQTFYETYTKTVLRLRKIPFTIEAPLEDPFYSEENLSRLKRSIQKLNAGEGTEHEIAEVE